MAPSGWLLSNGETPTYARRLNYYKLFVTLHSMCVIDVSVLIVWCDDFNLNFIDSLKVNVVQLLSYV